MTQVGNLYRHPSVILIREDLAIETSRVFTEVRFLKPRPTTLRLVALSSALFGGMLFGAISQAKSAPHESFRQLTMITPQTGWAIRNGVIVRTIDGGHD